METEEVTRRIQYADKSLQGVTAEQIKQAHEYSQVAMGLATTFLDVCTTHEEELSKLLLILKQMFVAFSCSLCRVLMMVCRTSGI